MRYTALVLAFALPFVWGQEHECLRECVSGDTRVCHYEFHVEGYSTMSKACYDCPNNITDCSRPHCIPLDGVTRAITTVNRQLPGPAIQVCKGDRVVVDVFNQMSSDSLTIHWHGVLQHGTPFMDGVPMVTQCPVLNAFRYNFVVEEAGTHFWHSHSGLQRGDGLFGGLVVRDPEDPHVDLYDEDLPEHLLVVSEWKHETTRSWYLQIHQAYNYNFAGVLTVNGKGRNNAAERENTTYLEVPFEVVEMEAGKRYRLRLVNGNTCPFLLTIDKHRFTAIATDSISFNPVFGDSIVVSSGERWDIIVEADQPIGNYWMTFTGLIDCWWFKVYQGAILRYKGAPDELPNTTLEYVNPPPPGIYINPMNHDDKADTEIGLLELENLEHNAVKDRALEKEVDKKFYLSFNIKNINNDYFHHEEYYSYNDMSFWKEMPTPQINAVSMKNPHSPLLTQFEDAKSYLCPLGQPSNDSCVSDHCRCTHYIEVGLGETVEFVLVDIGYANLANHPFHLHGYNFYVVAQKKMGWFISLDQIKAMDKAGLIHRKLDNPVLKDTVSIPDGGYTVIRFTADNPGWWFMHCHLLLHTEMGMSMVLHVGTEEDIPPTPPGFPTCGDFMPDF
ncbi:uncharacterized protein LOC143035925 [Oratosquilla oratoria]|uniref:uncharacterized protein LOC143035532 n=1 Tax=Oratosquilla oratoria TaxID=337810 RepID=UPI003F760D5A